MASGSEQLSAGAQQMSQGTTEQAASTEEASSSIEEMNATIKQNADNSQTTEKIARKSAQIAEEGGQAVNAAVGDTVEAGQVLVQLEGQEDLEAAVSTEQFELAQAEELNLYHLAQNLRNILAMEQEHAMDLQEALGK